MLPSKYILRSREKASILYSVEAQTWKERYTCQKDLVEMLPGKKWPNVKGETWYIHKRGYDIYVNLA